MPNGRRRWCDGSHFALISEARIVKIKLLKLITALDSNIMIKKIEASFGLSVLAFFLVNFLNFLNFLIMIIHWLSSKSLSFY